ncbi:MAG: S1 family peptidase [Thermoleophilia bacterium]
MALLPPHYLDAVVALGIGPTAKERRWIGTGFFYAIPSEKKDSQGNTSFTVFLISNRHVFENLKQLVIRLNSAADKTCKEYVVDLIARNGRKIWVEHPEDDVDVAALWINARFLQQDRRRFSFFVETATVLTKDKLAECPLTEGDGVYLLGYPMGIVGEQRNYVICRGGSIARLRDVKDGNGKEILVDAFVFPGNSGGPAITRPEIASVQNTKSFASAHLLGIVKSYVPYQDIAISQQTGNPRIIFEENSGLTSVVPAEFIRQTVALAMKRQKSRIAAAKYRAK